MNEDSNAHSSVSDIVRECGVQPAELRSVMPKTSYHTLKHITAGTTSGATLGLDIAAALLELAEQNLTLADRYVRAADDLRLLYRADYGGENAGAAAVSDRDAQIIEAARHGVRDRRSIASIAAEHGLTRERGRQVVERHEKRTGEAIPRYGKLGWIRYEQNHTGVEGDAGGHQRDVGRGPEAH
jgi:hypothetical protein